MNIVVNTTLAFSINIKFKSSQYISKESLELYIFPKYLSFFQTCISHHNWENFQIYGFPITEKCICKSKSGIYLFPLIPPGKTLPYVHEEAYFGKSTPTLQQKRGVGGHSLS